MTKKLLFLTVFICTVFLSSTYAHANEVYRLSQSEIDVQIEKNSTALHRNKSIGSVKAEKLSRCYLSEIISVSNDFDYSDISYFKSIKLYNFDNYVCAYWIQYYNETNDALGYCIVNSESGELIEFGPDFPSGINLLLSEAIEKNLTEYKIHISTDYSYYLSANYDTSTTNYYGINYDFVNNSKDYTNANNLVKSSIIESSKNKVIENPENYEFGYSSKTTYNVANYNKAVRRTVYYWQENLNYEVKNHCAPTAAVTLVRYYHDFCGKTQLKYNNSWKKTFTRIFNLLGSPTVGSTEDEILNALTKYVKQQLNKSSVSANWVALTSNGRHTSGGLTTYKRKMQANQPVLITMFDHHKYFDHGVVGFGYTSYGYNGTTSDYLMIADGLSTTYRYIHTTFGVSYIDFLNISI